MPARVIPAAVAARRPDRASPMPLWAQVSADLRRRCADGAFAGGVPGELMLCEEYDVSRHTIREALRALRQEGLISSGRGRGSVVRPTFSQSLGTVYSLFRSIEDQGSVQTSDVLRLAVTQDAAVASRLGLAPAASLVVLERVRLADGEPLAHDTSWLPHTLAHPLLAVDFTRTALYDELASRIGVHVDAGREQMSAVLPPPAIRRLLSIGPRVPTLAIERLATAAGRPVEWRRTHVRGDRFTVETTWQPGGTTSRATATPRTQTEGRTP